MVLRSGNWIAFTYASHPDWTPAGERLVKQIKATKLFREVIIFNQSSLFESADGAFDLYKDFLESNKRGGGYWIWKFLGLKILLNSHPTCGVMYIDAGCEIQNNFMSRRRLKRYQLIAERNGFLGFRMDHFKEHLWSKRDTVEAILPTESTSPTGQIAATCYFIAPNVQAASFVDDLLHYATTENFHLIDDSNSFSENPKDFVEHRHDQSILSLTAKKYGFLTIPDETHYPRNRPVYMLPIWGIRNNTGESNLKKYLDGTWQRSD
jgi:hypothetical protein